MSTPKNKDQNEPQVVDLPQRISAFLHVLYFLCYVLGAKMIRWYRRFWRHAKKDALHLKWAIRRIYFDFKDQQSVVKPTRPDWKKEWSEAFKESKLSLQEWAKHHKEPEYGIGGLFGALAPVAKKVAGGVNYILPVVGIIILTTTIFHFSTMTYGLQVQYNGEHIGYILSESDFIQAEAKVKERIVNEAYLPPEDSVPIYSLVEVEDDQISEQKVLINNIIRASGNEIVEAAGLYVNNEFVGAVEDGNNLLASLKSRKDGSYDPTKEEFFQETLAPTKPQEQPEQPTKTEPEEPAEQPKEEIKEETPPQEEKAPAPAETKEQEYTVAEGDSPWSIALKFDISLDDLLSKNPEVSKSMKIGEVLIIPGSGNISEEIDKTQTATEPETKPEPEPKPEAEKEESAKEPEKEIKGDAEYTVEAGDSPWSIAKEFNISVAQLLEKNPGADKKMQIGQVLIIPGAGSTPKDTQTEQAKEEKPALPQNKDNISFVQSIRLEEGLYPVSSIETIASINQKLDQVVEGEQTYTIQKGDSPWSIADKFDLPLKTLVALNPEVSKNMMVGDTFIISQKQPFLQTKLVRTVTEQKDIPFKTETEIDKNKEKSYQKTIQEGKAGVKTITSEITLIDGYETERNVISEEVLVEPVTAKVVVGSLSNYNFSGGGQDATESNVGGYIWPVNGGYISCPIWGYPGHTGTDIADKVGTTIWASKSGTVVYAGWSRGYGNNILIDHHDGTKTRYAHCDSLAVYQGQQVSQGQVIGYVGRTGNVTGPHCHFEIISNGTYLDARKYIGYKR